MNKKSFGLIAILIVLLTAYFLLRKNTGNTLTGNDRNFEFVTTERIDQIFMSNKFNHEHILLQKTENGTWIANDSFPANMSNIGILLEGLRKMRVKRPASKHEINYVKKDLALNGTKVEIYENNNLSKVFYVGGNTIDEMGTYLMMENGKEPYVCHIPGFNGFINARFFTKLDGWRSKNIFSLKDTDISSVTINWTENPSASFSISNTGNEPQLSSGKKQFLNHSEVNLNHLKTYLKLWENLSFEGFPIDLSTHQIDSIAHTTPILTIVTIDKKGNKITLSVHKKGIKRDSNIQFDQTGNPLQFDIESFYAFINNNTREVVQIQDYIFGKVMKNTSDFLIKK